MNKMLESFVPLVHFLGEVLGDTTEVVLQDCQEGQCIAAIANKEVTGRDAGSPLTDLSLKIIAEESWKNRDYITCYGGQSMSGHNLQCSTFFIKEQGELQGMLCINRDVSVPRQLLTDLEQYLRLDSRTTSKVTEEKYAESFSPSIHGMVEDTMAECLGKDYEVLSPRLHQEEKLIIIGKLEEKQVFLLKGAVGVVAEVLHCSEASVYRYLSKVQRK